MALVNICDVTVLNNPSSFLKPFQFEITFECLEDLPEGMLTLWVEYNDVWVPENNDLSIIFM